MMGESFVCLGLLFGRRGAWQGPAVFCRLRTEAFFGFFEKFKKALDKRVLFCYT